MPEHEDENLSRVMTAIAEGDSSASEELLPLVYDELRRLARAKLSRERPGQTLQPTALVHEAYLRLLPSEQAESNAARHWDGRTHFFGAAAEAMRRILIDRARRRGRHKHGGELVRADLPESSIAAPAEDEVLLGVHEVLDQYAEEHPQRAEIVKLRFFAGLTHSEIAAALGISEKTVRRRWSLAKLWLYRAIQADADGGS